MATKTKKQAVEPLEINSKALPTKQQALKQIREDLQTQKDMDARMLNKEDLFE